jgi:hypothetical protein
MAAALSDAKSWMLLKLAENLLVVAHEEQRGAVLAAGLADERE